MTPTLPSAGEPDAKSLGAVTLTPPTPLRAACLHPSSRSGRRSAAESIPVAALEIISQNGNLRKLYKDPLHPPTNDTRMLRSIPEVYLWRGCTKEQLMGIATQGSADGISPPDANAEAPSEEEAKKQVAEADKLPEFTNVPAKAEQFGRRNFVIVVKIATRYLTRGSVVEGGWVCANNAPVTLIHWKEGKTDSPALPRRSIHSSPAAVHPAPAPSAAAAAAAPAARVAPAAAPAVWAPAPAPAPVAALAAPAAVPAPIPAPAAPPPAPAVRAGNEGCGCDGCAVM